MVSSIGSRIKQARELAELIQDELAALVPTSPSLVSKWELDKVVPRLKTMQKLAACLGVRLRWLQHGEEPMVTTAPVVDRHRPTGDSAHGPISTHLPANIQVTEHPIFSDPWKLLEEVIQARGLRLSQDEQIKVVVLAASRAIMGMRDPIRKDVIDALGIVFNMEGA